MTVSVTRKIWLRSKDLIPESEYQLPVLFAASRFPNITPPLKMEDTVARIMQAILTNQKQVYIPRIMYLMAMLKT